MGNYWAQRFRAFFHPFWSGLPVIYEIVPHFSGAVRQVLYPCKTSKIFVEPLAFESMLCYTQLVSAGVMELVDVVDSKSTAGDSVPVRARSPAPKCVDKKDAQQKYRTKVRYFCVNAKKSRKYSSKSLKVKNPAPFYQNNETGDASKRKIGQYLFPYVRMEKRGNRE